MTTGRSAPSSLGLRTGDRLVRTARWSPAVGLALVARPASAHDTAGTVADAAVALPLVIAAVIYAAGLARLWSRAGRFRGTGAVRPMLFATGVTLVGLLLLSSLDTLADRALSVHMAQHLGLMLFAAPLLVLGRPGLVWLWALPARARLATARIGGAHASRFWGWMTHPAAGWLAWLLALWVWHAPPLHEAALASEPVHALQHASFLAAALVFWTAVLAPVRIERRAGGLVAVFATAVHSCALAALITTAGTVWYPAYGPSPLGLAPLADQQLGGLVMWVPCCALLIGGALASFARLLADLEARTQRAAS